MLIRIGLLGLVIAATISVSLTAPVDAQTGCYRPDGSMYLGVQPPADCSPVRPKSRDQAIQKDREIAGQPAPVNSDEAAKAVREESALQAEVSRRIELDQAAKLEVAKAQRAIKMCDAYKNVPSWMDEEQAALCYRVWAEKARQKLGR